MQDQELVLNIAQTLYDHKAGEITALKVGHLTVICDYMIIASGRTAAQVSALAEDVDEMMAREGRWVVLDYGHILIHLFHRDERAFYHLDRLWTDGTNAIALPFDQSVPD